MATKPSPTAFLAPRYRGKRFAGGRLPLEVLEDLAALQVLLFAWAKHLYLAQHPERKRTLKNLFSDVRLELGEVNEGSAITNIYLVDTAPHHGLVPSVGQGLIEAARDALLANLRHFGQAEPGAPHTVPPRLMPKFANLGKHLQSDETIEYPYPDGPDGEEHTVSYTTEVRTRIIASMRRTQDYTADLSLYVRVVEFDKQHKTCVFATPGGLRINNKVAEEWSDELWNAFSHSQDVRRSQRLLLEGEGLFEASGRLKEIVNLGEVTRLEPLDIRYRMEELKTAPKGWLDGQNGQPLEADQADRLTELLEKVFAADELLPLPHLYPTPEGNVQAEWTLGRVACSLEVDLATLEAEWLALNLDTQEDKVESLKLNESSGLDRLVGLLKDLKTD